MTIFSILHSSTIRGNILTISLLLQSQIFVAYAYYDHHPQTLSDIDQHHYFSTIASQPLFQQNLHQQLMSVSYSDSVQYNDHETPAKKNENLQLVITCNIHVMPNTRK